MAATFSPNLRNPIKGNDVLDVLHLVVPVAHCEAVLLDGGAWDRVERARGRPCLAGLKMLCLVSLHGCLLREEPPIRLPFVSDVSDLFRPTSHAMDHWNSEEMTRHLPRRSRLSRELPKRIVVPQLIPSGLT